MPDEYLRGLDAVFSALRGSQDCSVIKLVVLLGISVILTKAVMKKINDIFGR
jgi:hypothetical protein